jgi:hypothetical protein
VDFFDDDATSVSSKRDPDAPQPAPPRRRTDRRRTRIQRIVILAAILFVVVFGVAWWARSCQHARKIASYRDYFEGVATAISDSSTIGKQLSQIVNSPTKYSRKELVTKLQELSAKQDELAVRTDRLEAPDTLAAEQRAFAEGMRVRADGYQQLETAMLGLLANKEVNASEIAALAGYFSGPDAYYMSRVYLPARNVLAKQGVSNVAVPTATWYLKSRVFDLPRLQEMLASMGSSTKLSGVHGVGLASVTAQPGAIVLISNGTTTVTAAADLSFDVEVQNQGDVNENDVSVTAQLKLPGGDVLTKTGSIATIPAGKKQTVKITGWAVPTEALSKVSTLKVTAGPVEGERVKTNNTAQYKILLQLQ